MLLEMEECHGSLKTRTEAAWWLVAVWSVKSDDGSFVPTVITMLRSTCRAFYGDKHTNSPASLPSIHTNHLPGPGKLAVVLVTILCSVRFRFQNHSEVRSCQQVQNIILQ